jgi:hypothetical protein
MEDDRSILIIAYSAVALSGFVMGVIATLLL